MAEGAAVAPIHKRVTSPGSRLRRGNEYEVAGPQLEPEGLRRIILDVVEVEAKSVRRGCNPKGPLADERRGQRERSRRGHGVGPCHTVAPRLPFVPGIRRVVRLRRRLE